ncbi:MAG: CPBP family intramembrane glutamic endopeptidase [bacterium]
MKNKFSVMSGKEISKYFFYLGISVFIINLIWELFLLNPESPIREVSGNLFYSLVFVWVLRDIFIKCDVTINEVFASGYKDIVQSTNLLFYFSLLCLIIFSFIYHIVFLYVIFLISPALYNLILDLYIEINGSMIEPAGIYIILQGIFIILILPAFEEIFFRGFLLNYYRNRGTSKAILFSSLIFGALHPFDFLGATIFGTYLAVLYFKTKSMYLLIFIHGFYNLIVLLIPEIGGFNYILLITIITIISFVVVLYYIMSNWPEKKPQLFSIKNN